MEVKKVVLDSLSKMAPHNPLPGIHTLGNQCGLDLLTCS